ncbi:MAG TPA: hypothetical protein VF703_15785 [Pyrinomonadaceae bacterium]|jgi:hypothetical protein
MKISKGLPGAVLLALLLFPAMLMAQGAGASNPNESFKNLAGTPDEMARMHLPEAATLGVRSKAAMLPIRFRQDAAGNAVWSADVPVDDTGELKMTLLGKDSEEWQLRVSTGDVQLDLRQSSVVESQKSEVGFDGVGFPAEVFTLGNARKGNWKVEVTAGKRKMPTAGTAGYLVVSSGSPYRLYSYLNTHQTLTGKPLEFVASIFDERTDIDSSVPNALAGTVTSAEIEIRAPGGKIEKLSLDGKNRRLFRAKFIPREAGEYTAQITLRGVSAEGDGYVRTSEHVFRVLSDQVKLGAAATNVALVDDTRLRLSLPAPGLTLGRKVVAYAEVWSRDANGEAVPVTWIGGMAIAGGRKSRATVDLILDTRWLSRAGTNGAYELRNVRLQDADHFVTLAEAGTMALEINNLPETSRKSALVVRKSVPEITDDMRMGKRPDTFDAGATLAADSLTAQALGGKVLLIHGYCTGGNPFPVSQFSDYAVFHDPNQSRSHDQFANLIRNFGAQFPSFGAVAHSQGGAASLHLYTYYWSGFDYATGNRLIQSVGTPYQGTALAGNLAVLGQVFGAGCGGNSDLTYSGAASWLAGIPSWARARVHYSTTSFNDVWYRYDYCSLATDLFLGDPEDGVTERAYGQLPGGNNRGHKTGWCHTSGMRDPAQTSDSARNADMNVNAAR